MTRYLLDTHIVLWYLLKDPKLSQKTIACIMDPANDIFYSVVGSWELVTKKAKKKFAFPEHFFETLERQGFECLPITLSHTLVLRDLPNLHGDPFDRMLVAQAKSEHMTLITRDAGLAEYGVKCVLA